MPRAWSPPKPSPTARLMSYTYDAQGNLTSATDASGTSRPSLYGDPQQPRSAHRGRLPGRHLAQVQLQHRRPAHPERRSNGLHGQLHLRFAGPAFGADRRQRQPDRPVHLRRRRQPDPEGQWATAPARFTPTTRDGNVLSITQLTLPTTITVNSFDNYTYDALGNVLTDTNQDGEWVYTYDADSQLIQAVFTPNSTDPDGLTAQDLQYVYDAAGNRISETVNGVTTTYVANNVNEYTSSTTNGMHDDLPVRRRRQPDRADRRREHDDLHVQRAQPADRRQRAGVDRQLRLRSARQPHRRRRSTE